MSATSTKVTLEGDGARARIRGPWGDLELFVEHPHGAVRDLTPWVAPSMLAASSNGLPLIFGAPVDSLALDNAQRAIALLGAWFSRFAAVETRVPDLMEAGASGGVGCFFSGGVDSYYSVLMNPQITHLIFVHGFDIALSNANLAEQASTAARAAASDLGKELIEVRTNVRDLGEASKLDWGQHFHGAAMAAVAQSLRDQVSEVVVPSSYYVDDLFPWGSHPDLDPLWSSSSVKVTHHGTETRRPGKVLRIAESQTALNHLRVCWKNPEGAYNCGRCEKCVRTMINLRIAGALEACATLPDSIDASALRTVRSGHGASLFARENLAAMRNAGVRDPELERALQRLVRTAPIWDGLRRAKRLVSRR